jgi:hypothetical protein
MTRTELDEIKRRLADYRAAKYPTAKSRHRRSLETALVKHADALIEAAEARQVGVEPKYLMPAPPMVEYVVSQSDRSEP